MAKVKSELSSVELLEEALHLLRNHPAALAWYYLGAVPFVLGLLFFWADMSRSAYAASRCAAASLGLAAGYIWMKSCQAAGVRALWRGLGVRGGERLGWRGAAALAVTQTILHAWGLALLPVMVVLVVPFPFYHACCQNVTAIGLDESGGGARGVLRRAWAQAALWGGQNFSLILSASFFALLVLINVSIALGLIPQLLKMLLGVESSFTRSSAATLNSTYLAACCGLTYLCVDPLLKAAYVLRCFYGESLQSGDSIRAELRRLKRLGAKTAVGMIVAAAVMWSPCRAAEKFDPSGVAEMMGTRNPGLRFAASGATQNSTPAGSGKREGLETINREREKGGVAPAELDRSIKETLRGARYAWRLPRQLKAPEAETEKSLPARIMSSIGETVGGWLKSIGRAIGHFFDKLFSSRGNPSSTPTPSGGVTSNGDDGGIRILMLTHILLYLFAAIILSVIGLTLWRIWLNRQKLLEAVAESGVVAATPDLTDEQTSADQLPADSWLGLAQQMFERGEGRLALRALYLASLAALGEKGLLRIRKSKSNLDYVREMMRRAHAWPGLLELFRGNVAAFDRAWYGMYEVTAEGFEDFKGNYERIKGMVG